MEYAWSIDLNDCDGDPYEECVLCFIGDDTIIRFKYPGDLEHFAKQILGSMEEIREQWIERGGSIPQEKDNG